MAIIQYLTKSVVIDHLDLMGIAGIPSFGEVLTKIVLV